MNCLYGLSYLFKKMKPMHGLYRKFCYFELLKTDVNVYK